MRKHVWAATVVAGAIALAVGLFTGLSPVEQAQAVPDLVCEVTTTLLAGQHYDAGTVTAKLDLLTNTLTVTFTTTGGWQMMETHLHAATSVDGIPQTKSGNPKVGRFEYETYHDPKVSTYTYTIENWDSGTPIYIAAHAVVQYIDSTGQVGAEETAWGEGEPFGKNWSMYFVLDCS